MWVSYMVTLLYCLLRMCLLDGRASGKAICSAVKMVYNALTESPIRVASVNSLDSVRYRRTVQGARRGGPQWLPFRPGKTPS